MALFDDLLDTLSDVAAMGGTPWWIHAYGRPGEGGSLIIDECFDRLLGWVAPPACWAVAIVAQARLVPLDGAPRPAGVGPYDERLCLLADRDGTVACRLHHAGGAVSQPPAPEGVLVDSLARTFGRPTPPPSRPASDFVTVLWLMAIRRHLDDHPGKAIRWDDLIVRHPAVAALGGEAPTSADTFAVLDAARQAWGWSRLHAMAVDGSGLAPIVEPRLAGWMDEGMFARWVLRSAPPPPRLLAELRPRLPSAVRRRLNRCVTHLLAAGT